MNLLKAMLFAVGLLAAGGAGADEATVQRDSAAIIATLKRQFERPDAPLTVAPVSVVGDVAAAGWSQGEMGGRALLARTQNGWEVTLCAGDGLKDPQLLAEAGLDAATAEQLLQAMQRGEAALSPDYREKLSRFKGTVKGAHDHHGR